MTEQTTEITAYERSVALVKAELTQYKPKQIDTVLGLLQLMAIQCRLLRVIVKTKPVL